VALRLLRMVGMAVLRTVGTDCSHPRMELMLKEGAEAPNLQVVLVVLLPAEGVTPTMVLRVRQELAGVVA